MATPDKDNVVADLKDRFYRRKMTFDDLHDMNELSLKHKFEYGVANFSIALEEDTRKISEVIIEKSTGKVVAYIINYHMSNGFIYGFKVCVDGDYRDLRLSYLFTPFLDTYGNARSTSIIRFPFENHKFQYKLLIFNGMPKLPLDVHTLYDTSAVAIIHIERIIDESLLPSVLDYESQVICPDIDRTRFIKEWVYPTKFPVEAHAVVAKEGANIVGYGALRRGWRRNGWILSPVYADSDAAAFAMIDSLLMQVKTGEELNFAFRAESRLIYRLALALGLQLDCPLYGMRPQGFPSLSYSKERVYCTIQAWPL